MLIGPTCTQRPAFEQTLAAEDQQLLREQPWGERVLQIVETQEFDRLAGRDQPAPDEQQSLIHRCERCLTFGAMASLRSHIVQGLHKGWRSFAPFDDGPCAPLEEPFAPMPFHERVMLDMVSTQAHPAATMCQHLREAYSMKAALIQAPPLLCVQIDRLHATANGTVTKSSCEVSMEHEVCFPVFLSDQNLQCEMINYVPVAASAHLGTDQQGHYQAILKICPTVDAERRPITWLVTQDNIQAQGTWQVPTSLAQNITTMWLVRTDSLQLPVYLPHVMMNPSENLDPPDDTAAKILALLKK